MKDIAGKTRLLHELIRDDLPDEKHPLKSPKVISHVVSEVQRGGLLSESLDGESSDKKVAEKWKSEVDSWVNRALLLASSNMPDKCLAGIWLLGVTAKECSDERFLASYSTWLQKLLSHIQQLAWGINQEEDYSVQSIGSGKHLDYIFVLGILKMQHGFNIMYMGTAHHPLKYLDTRISRSDIVYGVPRLQIRRLPPADSHFVKVASCASLSDLFVRLTSFPKVKKDATSSAMKLVQAVLKLLKEDSPDSLWDVAISLICTLINFFPASVQRCYDNVESAVALKILSRKCSEKTENMLCDCLALLPKAKGDEESWSLMMQKILYAVIICLNNAFQGVEEESKGNEAMRALVPPGKEPPPLLGGQTPKQYERLHISSVSTLMQCCCTMLTRSYPVQVRVPTRSLIALVGRVLMVDESSTHSLFLSEITMQRKEFGSELLVLHTCSLGLLDAVIKGVRSQLLPHAAEVVRLVTEYFKRCKDPDLRIKTYSIISTLLESMGFGMAVYVTQDIVSNVFKDLDTNIGGTSSGAHSKGSDAEPSLKKRKHGRNTFEEQPVDSEVGKAKDPPKLSVKIAALKALETLLTVAGSVGAESWRPRVDRLLIDVATNACKMGSSEEHLSLSENTATWTDFQLAALSALLASLHSPGRTSPPYLGRCLDLFTRGRRETGTKLSEFCGHALLTLGSVIHPRVLPLVDLSSTYGASGVFPDSYSNGYTHFSTGNGHDESNLNDDDLYKTFIAEEEDDTEIPHAAAEKNPRDALLPASTSTSEKKEDEVMVEARESEEFVKQTEHPPPGGSAEAQSTSKNGIEESLMSDRVGGGLILTSKKHDGSEARADVLQTKGFDATMAKSFLENRKRDRDSDDESIESLPDIVDADPDSDSDSD